MTRFGDFEVRGAEPFARLPDPLRWRGPQSRWARMTRPDRPIHSFLEAACFLGDGSLILCDVAFGRLFGISPDGQWSLLLAYEGEPHAARPWGRDGFVILDYSKGLLRWSAGDAAPRRWIDGPGGRPFHGLSDAALAADGDLWFTDSGRSSLSVPEGRLFHLPAGADGPSDLRLVLDGLAYPNGVVPSADGRSVFVALTRANAVWRVSLPGAAGQPPMAGVFLHLSGGLGPDGLAICPATGRIAVAQAQAGRAYVFDAAGDPLFMVRTEGAWTTSVAFGPDGTLFIVDAEHGAIWRAPLPEDRSGASPAISQHER